MSANTEQPSTKKRRNQVQDVTTKAARVSSEEEREEYHSSGRDVKNMEQAGATTTAVTTQGADLNDNTDLTVELLMQFGVFGEDEQEDAENVMKALLKNGTRKLKHLRSICNKPDALVILERYGVPGGPANLIWDYFNRTFSLCFVLLVVV